MHCMSRPGCLICPSPIRPNKARKELPDVVATTSAATLFWKLVLSGAFETSDCSRLWRFAMRSWPPRR